MRTLASCYLRWKAGLQTTKMSSFKTAFTLLLLLLRLAVLSSFAPPCLQSLSKCVGRLEPGMITREKFILSSREGKCYQFAVNRYRLNHEGLLPRLHTASGCGKAITLILAHALGLHKETWEPFLEDLKLLQANEAQLCDNGVVTEAWSVDCPSHGDAAILNEKKLIYDDTFHSSQEYARSIMTLLDSTVFVSARSRRLILVGHSGGACAAALVMRECVRRWGAEANPFYSLVIIESPVLATPLSSLQERSDHWMVIGGMLSEISKKRRDKWGSVQEAYEWLRKRPPYSDWDPRALRRYVEFGMRPLPTAFYPKENTGITLKAYRMFESRPFGGREETTTAGAVLAELHPVLPVHIIFGQLSPFRPPDEDIPLLISRNGSNSFYASVTDIPDVNHLLVQEVPEIAARAVLDTINFRRHGDKPIDVQFSNVL